MSSIDPTKRTFGITDPEGLWLLCCDCPEPAEGPACDCATLLERSSMNARLNYDSYLATNPFSSLSLDSTWGRVCSEYEFYHTPRPSDNGTWDALYGRLGYTMPSVPPASNRGDDYWMPHNMLYGLFTGSAHRVLDENDGLGNLASGYRMLSVDPESPGDNGGSGIPYPVKQVGFPCEDSESPLTGKFFGNLYSNVGDSLNPTAEWIGTTGTRGTDSSLTPTGEYTHRNWRDRTCRRPNAQLVSSDYSDYVSSTDVGESGTGCKVASNPDSTLYGSNWDVIESEGMLMELTLNFNGTIYTIPKRLNTGTDSWSGVYTIWGMTGAFATGFQENGPKNDPDIFNPNVGRDMPVDIAWSYSMTPDGSGGMNIDAYVNWSVNYLDDDGDFPATGQSILGIPIVRRCVYQLYDGTNPLPSISNNYAAGAFTGRTSSDLVITADIYSRADGQYFTNDVGLTTTAQKFIDSGMDFTATFSFSHT